MNELSDFEEKHLSSARISALGACVMISESRGGPAYKAFPLGFQRSKADFKFLDPRFLLSPHFPCIQNSSAENFTETLTTRSTYFVI